MVAPELTTVSDDEVVIVFPAEGEGRGEVRRYGELRPDEDYTFDGLEAHTLARPGGELLTRIATVNDLHFGETVCGLMEGIDLGPVLRSGPGEDPYPLVMNRAAAAEIRAAEVDLIVAKGDLTDAGLPVDLAEFHRCYGDLGARLVAMPGNHDVTSGRLDDSADLEPAPLPAAVDLPGVTVALIDTNIPGQPTGRVTAETLGWLDELGSRADRPVLVMGHHQPWAPGSATRPATYFGINPDDSEALAGVFGRRPRLAAYTAGHTHRNRVRRFEALAGPRPWVEVASVKEFPGCWAEYRVFEGGILQVVRRMSEPAALEWSERTRALYGGTYPGYAFGTLGDRCLRIA